MAYIAVIILVILGLIELVIRTLVFIFTFSLVMIDHEDFMRPVCFKLAQEIVRKINVHA